MQLQQFRNGETLLAENVTEFLLATVTSWWTYELWAFNVYICPSKFQVILEVLAPGTSSGNRGGCLFYDHGPWTRPQILL